MNAKTDPRQTEGNRDSRLAKSEKRPTRIPMGRQQRLDAIATPYLSKDYYVRFALDKPGRIEQYLAAGYEFVTDSNGKNVTFPSGSQHLHLMRLPMEFRLEDLNAHEADISTKFKQQVGVGQGEYTPAGAQSALTAGETFDPDAE